MKFDEDEKSVIFKSSPLYFFTERDNFKCCTIRMLNDVEWTRLQKFISEYNGSAKITIQKSGSEERFTRWITDVTWEPRWGSYEVCISWRDERVDALYSALHAFSKAEIDFDTPIGDANTVLALVENPHEYYNELSAQKKLVAQLSDALQLLYDEQNGVPLYKSEEMWRHAMESTEEALKAVRA